MPHRIVYVASLNMPFQTRRVDISPSQVDLVNTLTLASANPLADPQPTRVLLPPLLLLLRLLLLRLLRLLLLLLLRRYYSDYYYYYSYYSYFYYYYYNDDYCSYCYYYYYSSYYYSCYYNYNDYYYCLLLLLLLLRLLLHLLRLHSHHDDHDTGNGAHPTTTPATTPTTLTQHRPPATATTPPPATTTTGPTVTAIAPIETAGLPESHPPAGADGAGARPGISRRPFGRRCCRAWPHVPSAAEPDPRRIGAHPARRLSASPLLSYPASRAVSLLSVGERGRTPCRRPTRSGQKVPRFTVFCALPIFSHFSGLVV